ncbi:hypothetical protein AB0G73_34835 [Streptomyces sp. NPDC020719]
MCGDAAEVDPAQRAQLLGGDSLGENARLRPSGAPTLLPGIMNIAITRA